MTLLPEVRDELWATAARRAAADRHRSLRVGLPRFGRGLALTAAVVCPVLVVVALVFAGGHRPAVPDTEAGPRNISALIDRLSVLRRPQTAADREFPRGVVGDTAETGLALDRRLVRLLAVLPTRRLGTVRVYLIVQVVRHPRAQASTRSDRRGTAVASLFAITSRADNGHPGYAGTRPVSAAQLDDPVQPLLGVGPSNLQVGLVPDDVSRVEFVYSGARFGVVQPHPVSVSVSARNNFAVVRSRAADGPLLRVTWYGAGDRVLASATGGEQNAQQVALIGVVNASRQLPIAPSLQEHFALFRTVKPTTPAQNPATTLTGSYGRAVRSMRLNYWQARYVRGVTGFGGRGLWVTPGTHGVCVLSPLGGWCIRIDRRSDPDRGGFSHHSSIGNGERAISGIVPDGNRTVTLVLADGARVNASVTDNVYEATVHGRIVAIIDHDATGRLVHHPLR